MNRSGTNLRFSKGGQSCSVQAWADQGQDWEELSSRIGGGALGPTVTTFGGVPAILRRFGTVSYYTIHSRRRLIQLSIRGGANNEALLREIEDCLAPTFAATPGSRSVDGLSGWDE